MKNITISELPENLAKYYTEYDLVGFSDIYRAKVSINIEVGDIFNIYRGESTKEGCEWVGNLEKSLTEHLELKTDDK
ncbi:hypothetical protein ACMGDK_11620 [Chryseobacterium sp. DT-3]|uniref:hypothetical protein n=1 Tax=Chryseobacterium sp. DT-3 TaxID=3396164 RepID=UPI003F1B3CF1